jgi:hypothetical protein
MRGPTREQRRFSSNGLTAGNSNLHVLNDVQIKDIKLRLNFRISQSIMALKDFGAIFVVFTPNIQHSSYLK